LLLTTIGTNCIIELQPLLEVFQMARSTWSLALTLGVALVVCLSVPLTASVPCPTCPAGFQTSNVNETAVLSQLETHLQDYLREDASRRNWCLRSQEVSCVDSTFDDTYGSATFEVHRRFTLDYDSPSEAPAIKGRLAYLNDHSEKLTQSERAYLEQELDIWLEDITTYIEVPQDCYERIKVVGLLGTDGSIDVGTLRVFGEGPMGEYVPLNLDDIPSPMEAQQAAYEGLREIHLSRSGSSKGTTSILANYDRLAARDYANTWTSNPSGGWCKDQTVDCTQDDTEYNRSVYTTWWCCSDCANYVSQCLKAGGIPTDATWKPYTTTWIRVLEIEPYMVDNGYWETASLSTCVAGYPFLMKKPVAQYNHIMMMVLNDGVTRLYSAHTSDRKQWNWGGATGTYYYRVVY